MSNLYGDSIFESLEINYNMLIESSKIFLEADDSIMLSEADSNGSSFKDKLLHILDTIITKLKKFLDWIKIKVRQFLKTMATKFKALDLKRKLAAAKARVRARNEAADDLPEKLDQFLKTRVDIYRIPESTNTMVKKVYNINSINIEQNEDGDYILTIPGKGIKSEFIECFKNTVEVFIDKYQVYVLSLQQVADKLINSATTLEAKLAYLKQKYKDIKNMEAIESLNALKATINEEDSLTSDIGKVNTLIKNHTSAINAVTESINRMMTISNGIEHSLATL